MSPLGSSTVNYIAHMKNCFIYKNVINQQVQKSVDNQFKKAIEQYRDDPDLQNAIDAVQEGVSHWRNIV